MFRRKPRVGLPPLDDLRQPGFVTVMVEADGRPALSTNLLSPADVRRVLALALYEIADNKPAWRPL